MIDEIGVEHVSEWIEVSQSMIDLFADATGDHQSIHVDPAAAAQTRFGGTIAHGFLTLSLMTVLLSKIPDLPRFANAVMEVNYGGDRVRFVSPVRSGSRVRGRSKLLKLTEKHPNQFQQTFEFTVEIEGEDKPALIAEWMNQVVTQPNNGNER